MKTCPICKGHKVITFDSDNDWCETCRKYFPSVAPEKCAAGCQAYTGDEIRHHKDCIFYPESFSKRFDDLEKKHADLRRDISLLIVEIQQKILKKPMLPSIDKTYCVNRLLGIFNKDEEQKDIEAWAEKTIKDLEQDE